MNKEELEYMEFKRKYKTKLAKEMGTKVEEVKQISTSDYEEFKSSFLPKNFSLYEKTCNFAEKILPIQPDKKAVPKIQDALRVSHLNISPTGTMSFAALGAIAIILFFFVAGYIIPFLLSGGKTADMFFFIFFGIIMAVILFIPLTQLPFIIANAWRMRATNQMVLSTFYVVTYMRHTSNLELAVAFAAEHLSPPLALDFKKIIWDVETGKFDNVSQSLDHYLEQWKEHCPEYIESMHLIQSSLYESSESRRIDALDKSLSVILDETFEKMLHYTHDLKGPITTLHMLGIVLPILGLVILPLVTAFMSEAKWYHIFALYNLALPALVYYLGKQILSTRPTGYGGIDMASLPKEKGEQMIKFNTGKSSLTVTPATASTIIIVFFLLMAISPLIIHALNPTLDIAFTDEGILLEEDLDRDSVVYARFLDYRPVRDEDGYATGDVTGPFGLGANLLSLGFPLSFGLGLGLFYKWRTSSLAKLRKQTTKLEEEFASALFQLGNRLADGIPAEIAFSNVAKVMQGTESGKFFELISMNIMKLGLGVNEAIFDSKVGAIHKFPSSIIQSSMKVFVESSRKGPLIASRALITVAEYIKSMHRVDERLKDLMADVVSSMKSQISFLTPIIAGVVVGITSMIAQILGVLSEKMTDFQATSEAGMMGNVMDMFGAGGVPTFYFQAIVGLYVVQITYILSVIINGIQNGSDKIGEMETLGANLIMASLIYLAVAGLATLGFSMIAGNIAGSMI